MLLNEDKEDTEKDLEDVDDMQDQAQDGNEKSQGPSGGHTPTAENQARRASPPTQGSGMENVKAFPYLPVPLEIGTKVEDLPADESALQSERAQEMERLFQSVTSEKKLIQEVQDQVTQFKKDCQETKQDM